MKDKLSSGFAASDPTHWDIRERIVFCSIQGLFGRHNTEKNENKHVSFRIKHMVLLK